MNFKNIPIFLILFVFAISCHETTGPTEIDKNNNPPRIVSLTSQSNSVAGAQEIQLVCIANDQDNDKLNYTWEAENGRISGTGSIVYWVSPNVVGDYVINCTVDDMKGGSVKESISILVESLSSLPLQITYLDIQNKGKIDKSSTVVIVGETNKSQSDQIRFKWGIFGGSYSLFENKENLLRFAPQDENGYVVSYIVKNEINEIDIESLNFFVGDTIPGDDYVKLMQFIASKNNYTSKDTIELNFFAVTNDNSPINYEIKINGIGNNSNFEISTSFSDARNPFVFKDLDKFVTEDNYTLIFTCCVFDNKKNSDIQYIQAKLVR